MKRVLMALVMPLFLAACGAESVYAPEEDVQRAIYRHDAPPSITVLTVVSNRDGSGGHSALLIKGSQSVIFDPAGSYRHSKVVERGDVIYGVSPGRLQSYKSAHARSTFHVVSQEIPVSAAQAEQALRLAIANGSKLVHSRGHPISHSTHVGFRVPPTLFSGVLSALQSLPAWPAAFLSSIVLLFHLSASVA